MMQIAIVEDCHKDKYFLAQTLEDYGKEKNIPFIIDLFENGEELLSRPCSGYDLIFMDMELGQGLNGIETAARIREKNQWVLIVIVTSLIQYAIQGYSIQAADFLLKPVTTDEFFYKMDAWIKICKTRQETIILHSGNNLIKYRVSEIMFVEVYGHKLLIHHSCGVDEITGTLKNMEEQLTLHGFVKCNKCYLVNLAYVDRITDDFAEVSGTLLKISRREKKNFIDLFTHYVGG